MENLKNKDIKDSNVRRAYLDSLECGFKQLNIRHSLYTEQVKDIVEECRLQGVVELTISCKSTNTIEILGAFEDEACKCAGTIVLEIKNQVSGYTDIFRAIKIVL